MKSSRKPDTSRCGSHKGSQKRSLHTKVRKTSQLSTSTTTTTLRNRLGGAVEPPTSLTGINTLTFNPSSLLQLAVRGMKSKSRGGKIGSPKTFPGKVAKDPNQIQMGLTRRAETALQMIDNLTPSAPQGKSIHRIGQAEKTVRGKLNQLELFLSHPPTAYSIGEILSIYNTFKEVRFAAPIKLWGKMMRFWKAVGDQKALDGNNRKKALQIPLELLDELMTVSKMGVYSVMKQKNLHLPEHLLQFNLRPNSQLLTTALHTLHAIGNYEGVLQLHQKHKEMLEEIPDVQYLPEPLMPEGPEKEQEFVSRRLMANRRSELQYSAPSDNIAMSAALKLKDYGKMDELMDIFMTKRAFQPTGSSLSSYQNKLVRNNEPITAVVFFKEYFQPQVKLKQDGTAELQETCNQIAEKLAKNGTIRKTVYPAKLTQDPNTGDEIIESPEQTVFTNPLRLSIPIKTTIPSWFGHVEMKRSTVKPGRQHWVELLRAVAHLHSNLADEKKETVPLTPSQQADTTTTALAVVKGHHNQLKTDLERFALLNDTTGLIKNKNLRKQLYKVAKEEYGIAIDKSFFLPIIKESKSYDEVLAFLGDFHDEVEELRTKFKSNPWTEEELAAQEKEKKLKSMLVVNLNVTPHDQRMRKLFGRYVDEVKALGYDQDVYAAVHKKLVEFLVNTYQADTEENTMETGNNNINMDEMYDIETVVLPDGTLQKIRKLKKGPDGEILNLRSGKKRSLYDAFKQSQQTMGLGDNNEEDLKEGEYDLVEELDHNGQVKMRKVKKNHFDNMNQNNTTNSSSSTSSDDNALSNLPPPLAKSELVAVVDKFNRGTTDMLMASTSRKKVQHILGSIQTVRAYQEVYGLPVGSQTESNYLEALVLMSRRNEIYPPVLGTSDTSLIKYDVVPYIPSFDGESTGTDEDLDSKGIDVEMGNDPKKTMARIKSLQKQTTKPLVTFKDRLNHIHTSIRRREDQLRLTMQEIENSIDALGTMKNETDEYGKLQQINIKVLSDVIESLSELAVDASILRGPFDEGNIFHYSAPKAHEALGKLSRGEAVEGMKIDKKTNAKFIPGITEPHPYQIDRVDLEDFISTSQRVQNYSFGEMKAALQKLITMSTGMTPQQVQHIPLLQADKFGQMVTENTYVPMLRACAAHGDFQNVLLLIESAHQHRDVIPTTNMLNYVAIAFMNSNKQRHAAGVLDIMQTASNPENRKVRTIKESELQQAITHGTADDLLEVVQTQLEVQVLPNAETVSLLLRMYKSQGMLDHVEELWRRLTYHDPTSWTSFSAVEEQKMVAQVLANELDAAMTKNHPMFEKLAGTQKGDLSSIPSLSMSIEDVYDKALNPVQNKALQHALKHDEIRTNMRALLYNRTIQSNLPHGAHRTDIPKGYIFNELRLDSSSMTVMLQTFIQLGHPMHALQMYLDLRQSMPLFPISPPKHSKAYQKARELNRFINLHQSDPNFDSSLDSLTDFMIKTQGKGVVQQALEDKNQDGYDNTNDVMVGLLAVPSAPSKRSFVTDKGLVAINGGSGAVQTDAMGVKVRTHTTFNLNALSPKMVQMGHISAQTTVNTTTPSENALVNSSTYEQLMAGTNRNKDASPFEQIRKGLWPEVDSIASLALYTYKKGEQYLKKLGSDGKPIHNIPPEVLAHAQLLVDASSRVLSSLKRYTVDTPYLPGDESTLLYYSHPGTLNNVISPNAGIELTQPRLLLPLTTDNEHIYRDIDVLVYSDIALEETVFKIRYQTIKPIGMQRWFTIFPTMINQCKAINHSEQARVEINQKLDTLRDDVEMLLATGRRKPKYVRIAEIINEKRLTGTPLTPQETKLIESQGLARTESAQSNSLQIGGLHKNNVVQDRGISHPKTTQFVEQALPAAPLFDLTEFTQKDDASKAWVSNFKQFFNSKKDTGDFLKGIATAPAMDQAKKDELKKKLLGQTKKVSDQQSSSQPTTSTTTTTSIDDQSSETVDPSSLPLIQVENEQSKQFNKPTKKFDRWVDQTNAPPQAPTSLLPTPVTGELPVFPFMKDSEKNVDGKKLIQQIKKELEDAQTGIGLYTTTTSSTANEDGEVTITKQKRKPVIGPDGRIKTEFIIEDGLPGGLVTATGAPKTPSARANHREKANSTIKPWTMNEEENTDDEIASSSAAAVAKGLVPVDAEFKRAVRGLQQYDIMDKHLTPAQKATKRQKLIKDKNALLLPEVQQMKTHLSKQAAAQRAIMEQYTAELDSGNNKAEEDEVTVGGYANKLTQMMQKDLTLLKPFQKGDVHTDNLDLNSQPAQWLSNPTDIAMASQITARHVKVMKDKFKPLPGIIEEDHHNLHQRAEFMKKIGGENQSEIPSKALTRRRPGGIHTSPHGPQSFRPENQFRSPSSMAKLANTPDDEVDQGKLALSNQEKNIKFTVQTHGVGMSDRPGRPTQISQEYLERYLMGIGADPKDKRNQARHAKAEAENDSSPMDPSFIQMGDPTQRLTNRGGGTLPDGTKAGSHQQGYGVGVHKFRERSHAKFTELAQQGASKLLHDFEAETFQRAGSNNNPMAEDGGLNLERDFTKIPKKERELLEYKNLFELGGSDDEVGSAAMARTGSYNMLTNEDKASRDDAMKKEGFADLEAQMEALLGKRQGQTKAINKSLGDDNYQFGQEYFGRNNKSGGANTKKIKEVFASASMHKNKTDYFGLNGGKRGNGKKRADQSTMFD